MCSDFIIASTLLSMSTSCPRRRATSTLCHALNAGGSHALLERLLLVAELVASITMFRTGSRWRVNTPHTVLLCVLMLPTRSPGAEGFENEILPGKAKQQFHFLCHSNPRTKRGPR